jgi:NAD+ synthase
MMKNPLLEVGRIGGWISEFVGNVGAEGVVIGLSGGIDSSLVAGIAARGPLGSKNVLGVILPCESDPKDKEDALVIAKWLGIDHYVVDLTEAFKTLVAALPPAPGMSDLNTLTKANIKARLRMTVLYAFANERNYLNMGTGNKSELMIGYITKYGDGGVDFEPLGEYFKDEVYEMAAALGVPQQVIGRKQGLRPRQEV